MQNTQAIAMQVTESGGAQQVIRDKLWRDVGDAFHLPKTITSLSYVLKRGYMQYLWDYEQVRLPLLWYANCAQLACHTTTIAPDRRTADFSLLPIRKVRGAPKSTIKYRILIPKGM